MMPPMPTGRKYFTWRQKFLNGLARNLISGS